VSGGLDVAGDLAALLRTLCEVRGEEAAALLGDVAPSELSTVFVRIEPTHFAAFAAIELQPWSGEGSGIVLPELAADASWSVPALADLVGPLEEGSRTQGLGPQLQGFFDEPESPARAAVYVVLATDDPESPVEEVRVRIETRS
jgi:hypothetical protein